MTTLDMITQVLFETIDEVNQQLPDHQRMSRALDTAVFGENGRLDSLELVNFILAIEQRIEEKFETSISLVDEHTLSQSDSPFRTVGALAQQIAVLLAEEQRVR